MKVCPNCQSSYPDGFKYCPQDNSTLLTGEEFARRAQPVAAPSVVETVPEMAAVVVPPAVTVPETAAPYIAPRDLEYRATEPEPAPAVVAPPAEELSRVVPKAPIASTVATVATTVASPPVTRAAANADIGLNLALPEPGNLFSRFIASFQNIKDIKFGGNKLAAGTTQGFQVLIPDESLVSRIGREVGLAWQDFRRSPKQFFIELVRGDGSNLRRRNMLLAGSEMALVGYGTLYLCFHALASVGKGKPALFNVICIALSMYLIACYAVRGFLLSRLVSKFSQITVPKLSLEAANWVPLIALLAFVMTSDKWFCQVFPSQCGVAQAKTEYAKLFEPIATEEPKVNKPVEKVQKEVPKGKGGFTGGSKKVIEQARGGGGQNTNAPVSKGVAPQMTQLPQVMPPTLRTPTIKNPSLVVPTTTVGDDALSKAMAGRIGDPNGADAPPSLGTGKGTGLGAGEGGGQGPGRGGNKGGGDMSIGGGPGGDGSGGIFAATASLKPTILYKEKAKYTEAARQNRVQGTVLVSAVFTADGKVTAIRVVRGLPDGLNDEAIKAAQKIKFTPAMRNGQAVSVRMQMEFSFNLL